MQVISLKLLKIWLHEKERFQVNAVSMNYLLRCIIVCRYLIRMIMSLVLVGRKANILVLLSIRVIVMMRHFVSVFCYKKLKYHLQYFIRMGILLMYQKSMVLIRALIFSRATLLCISHVSIDKYRADKNTGKAA